MFSSIVEVLEVIMVDGVRSEQTVEACMLLEAIQTFDFVFTMHLIKSTLAITNELSLALQKKEQEIENAMRLVQISKERLSLMREDHGWDSLLEKVSTFCSTHEIVVPNMDDKYVARGRPRRGVKERTNKHHFRFELFNTVIDKQVMELNNRFSEADTELLLCVGCLNPNDGFSAFNKEMLIKFARMYPKEFSSYDIDVLEDQLDTYIFEVRSNSEFSSVEGIAGLAKKMVQTRKHTIYPLVYMLITLALTLPVSTASVERAFSAMKIVKNRMRNRIGDEWLDACLVAYIEKDILDGIDNEVIIQRFQTMRPRRSQL